MIAPVLISIGSSLKILKCSSFGVIRSRFEASEKNANTDSIEAGISVRDEKVRIITLDDDRVVRPVQ